MWGNDSAFNVRTNHKNYGSYTARNPKTCVKTEVKEKKLPFFKVDKELKKRVDRK